MEGNTLNIVYLIGNGFDLNQGLKTGFRDFLEFYLQQNCHIGLIYDKESKIKRKKLAESVGHEDIEERSVHITEEIENMKSRCFESVRKLKEAIREEGIESWSDLERKIGEFTTQLSTYEEVEEVRDDLVLLLSRYLKYESLISNVDEDDAMSLWNSLYYPEKKLSTANNLLLDKSIVEVSKRIKADYTQLQRNISVISFNYTNTIENILSKLLTPDNASKDNNLNKCPIIHVHGKLDDDSLILGVDNKEQIKNVSLSESSDVRNILVKPIMNDNLGDANDIKAQEMISYADIIVVYGMSLGATDSTWWYALIKWMLVSANHKLIIHWHDNEQYEGINRMKQGNVKDRIKDLFYSYCTEVERLNLNINSILIEINKEVFAKCVKKIVLEPAKIRFDKNNKIVYEEL